VAYRWRENPRAGRKSKADVRGERTNAGRNSGEKSTGGKKFFLLRMHEGGRSNSSATTRHGEAESRPGKSKGKEKGFASRLERRKKS